MFHRWSPSNSFCDSSLVTQKMWNHLEQPSHSTHDISAPPIRLILHFGAEHLSSYSSSEIAFEADWLELNMSWIVRDLVFRTEVPSVFRLRFLPWTLVVCCSAFLCLLSDGRLVNVLAHTSHWKLFGLAPWFFWRQWNNDRWRAISDFDLKW